MWMKKLKITFCFVPDVSKGKQLESVLVAVFEVLSLALEMCIFR